MNTCLLALALVLGCPAPEAPRVPEDAWLAEDKLQHFTVSAAATAMGYGGARFVLDADEALVTAGAVALGLGIAKELVDVRRGGPFSLKDLVWDAAGVALGLTLANGIR